MEHFIKWKENAAGNVPDWQFFESLMDQIQHMQQLPLVGKIFLKEAMKQADPMMVELLISGAAEAKKIIQF